jgi:hypothetical protein
LAKISLEEGVEKLIGVIKLIKENQFSVLSFGVRIRTAATACSVLSALSFWLSPVFVCSCILYSLAALLAACSCILLSHRSGVRNPFTFKKWPPDLRLNTPAIVNIFSGNSYYLIRVLCSCTQNIFFVYCTTVIVMVAIKRGK